MHRALCVLLFSRRRRIAAGLSIAVVAAMAHAQEPDAGGLKVVGLYPADGEAIQNRITVIFNEDIVVPEDAASAPFVIEPPLQGDYDIGPNHISFRLAQDVGTARQVYAVTLHPGIRSAGGASLPASEGRFHFGTYDVALSGVQLHEQTDRTTALALGFTAPLNLDSLKQHVAAKDRAGNAVALELSDWTVANSYILRFPANTQTPVTVTLGAGIRDKSDRLRSGAMHEFTYPKSEALTVSGAAWKRDAGAQDRVEIGFSGTVLAEQLKKYVALTNAETGAAVAFKIVPQGPSPRLTLEISGDVTAAKQLKLSVNAGLVDSALNRLTAAYSAVVERESAPLQITGHYWQNDGIDGASLRVWFNGNVKANELAEGLSVGPPVDNIKVAPGNYNQVTIEGDWRSETDYRLTISAGLTDAAKSLRLDAPLTYTLQKTPKISGITFGYEGLFYFPRQADGALTVEARNVEETSVTLYRLFPSNIVPAMNYISDGSTNSSFNYALTQEIGAKKVALPAESDTVTTVGLDLDDLMPAGSKGVFSLQLTSGYRYNSTKIVLYTDIGLLAHWQNDELVVFAHDLFSLEPVPGAQVTVYSHKNQTLGTANTDARGIAHLRSLDTGLGLPRVVVVERENDFTFLELEHRAIDAGTFGANMPNYDRAGYDAFVYADRNLYRPGETIHARWIVRSGYGDAVRDMPLLLRVLNPKGRELLAEPVTLSAIGTGGLDVETQATYLTGGYTLELRVPGAKTALQTHSVNVEEFVPNRIKAAVSVAQKVWAADTPHRITVSAQHLFGANASGRKAEASVILRRSRFTSERWKGFTFNNDTPFTPGVQSLGESRTNKDGAAEFTYTYAPPERATFPLTATLRGQVFELGGRAVTATEEVLLFPSNVALGISTGAKDNGRTLEVGAAAIQPDETPADLDTVEVTLEKRTWHYYVRRYVGRNEPSWTESFEALDTKTVKLSKGLGKAEFSLPDYGHYRVRVHSEKTPQFASQSFYQYGSRFQLLESAKPDLVTLSLDKATYEIGDEVALRIESPFDGKCIAVVQGESIDQVIALDIEKGAGTARFALTRAHYPNVWVETTVIHEVEPGAGQTHPYSSFAMVNIPLRDTARQLSIDYPGLPEKIRPDQDVPIQIETRDAAGNPVSAEVTLAAVDEGIHSILQYRNPDPYTWFQRPRRPDVRRAHYYDRVAYDFSEAPIGGGALLKRMGEGGGADENWIKPVALWSGAVTTDASGTATVTLRVPEFNGNLRLVAVAATEDASGAHSAGLFVKRPFILRTSMPRFALPGDAFRSSAVVFNSTETERTARVRWSPSGTLADGGGSKELPVPPNGEIDVLAEFTASTALGQGAIEWNVDIVDSGGQVLESLNELAPIPVRAPATFQSHHALFVLAPGESRTFTNTQFLDDARAESRISVGANPLLRLKDSLGYVMHYPYGCLEQTTSRAFPLYLLRESVALVDSALTEQEIASQYVGAAVDRLFSMQTPSGGLAFWPGGNDPDAYGSIYACHFLTLVRKDQEIEMPEEAFRALQTYVRRIADATSDGSASSLYRRAYAYYVLALDGQLGAIEAIERFDTIEMPRSARYLLAAALAMNSNDLDRVRTYLERTPSLAYEARERSGNFNSAIRNTAVELLALMEMQTDPKTLHEYATKLIQHVETVQYRNTQDTAFIVTALGTYLNSLEDSLASAKARITDPNGDRAIAGAELFETNHAGPGQAYTVSNEGGAALFVNFTTAGIPKQPNLNAVHEGIGIARQISGSGGGSTSQVAFTHGESYVVDLKIVCDQVTENVIVADLLPAGFEIENPRIDSDALLAAGIQGTASATPSYLEVRDDRLLLAFDRLNQGTHHFYYVVRAVTRGQFQYPPVTAECMYDARLRGSSAPSNISIKGIGEQ